MIRSTLIKIRRKPKYVRDNIALGIAGTFTAAVFAVWFLNTPTEFLQKGAAVAEESPRAFSTFFQQIGKQFASVKESLPDPTPTTTPAAAIATSLAAEPTVASSSEASASSSAREVMIVSMSSSTATTTATTAVSGQ